MKVVISAGGTGGHINPALAIIDKIKQEDKKSEFLYIGTTNRMEKDIVPEKGIPYVGIEMQGLRRSLSPKNLVAVFKYIKGISTCKKEIRKFNPDIVIGTGGYVTAPVIYAAKKCGYKTLVHEQNSILGLSNRILLKYTDTLCTSFESMKPDNVHYVYTGNPTSESTINKKPYDKTDFKLSKSKKLVLIVMGSLGSSTVNEILKGTLKKFGSKNYQVVIVTGKGYYEDFSKLEKSKNVFIFPYIDDLPRLMKVTDVLVTRAGASTLSEIMATKTPSILVPSPYVTENHQYKNAMDLVKKNAGVLLEEKDLTEDKLITMIDDLINDSNKMLEIKDNLEKLCKKNSTTLIYKEILKIINKEK
ncbi:MAG: undecaprenyldiphospho-muramoylpentapeptide beta-N-acetylglucosaminyltransferase [Bacilli bacterium]|nr:undecaprenyldiphospho-muramoylpentapeptide beta-N-acetylglucosaminyltransferase [Bacilli bacterium]MBP3635307.1 undecaprenyldiphospho-muramoylpentapeptide beta-N-acetylglucosaminyltransferase [Bacilli bacterium]